MFITLQEFRAIAPRIFVYSAAAAAGAHVAKHAVHSLIGTTMKYVSGASASAEDEAPEISRISKSSSSSDSTET